MVLLLMVVHIHRPGSCIPIANLRHCSEVIPVHALLLAIYRSQLKSLSMCQVRVSGELSISFYDIVAGTKILKPVKIPARSSPHHIEVDVDASNLPTGKSQPSCCSSQLKMEYKIDWHPYTIPVAWDNPWILQRTSAHPEETTCSLQITFLSQGCACFCVSLYCRCKCRLSAVLQSWKS